MEVLIKADNLITNMESLECETYDCGCDVEGNCNPDCPGYNPCADCWTGE